MYKKYKDVVIGGILGILSCIYLAMSLQIKLTNIDRIVGSRLFPQMTGTVILLLSIWLIVSGMHKAKREAAGDEGRKKNHTRTMIVLGSFAAYIFLMDKIGFTASSVFYLFSQMVVMGPWPAKKKSIILYLVISIITSITIYVMFNQVFMLMLPKAGWL